MTLTMIKEEKALTQIMNMIMIVTIKKINLRIENIFFNIWFQLVASLVIGGITVVP